MSSINTDKLNPVPEHIAIVMDGNGRWAKNRKIPRFIGHKRGLDTLQNIVKSCIELGVSNLTVFAFSTENWKRPKLEVDFLMKLFLASLENKLKQLHENNIRFRFIGQYEPLDEKIIERIKTGEELTKNNTLLTLTIAANYGGRWDIVNAVNQLIKQGCTEVTEENIKPFLALSDIPEPDLYIRTGGEMRLSNFMLWQMAYSEFYFTETLWPEFDDQCLKDAIVSFQQRERRFGRTSEQLSEQERRD